jgi:hypothetical protein
MEPYFKLRSKSNKKDFHQIQLIYLHGGKEKRLGTGRSVPSKYWNRKEERITAKAKEIDIDYIEINGELDRFEAKIKGIISKYKRDNEVTSDPDSDYVYTEFLKNDPEKSKEKNVILCLEDFIQRRETRVKDRKLHDAILDDLKDFLESTGRPINKFYFKDINNRFLEDWVDSLLKRNYIIYHYKKRGKVTIPKKKIGLENSTIKKRISTFKTFIDKMRIEHKNVNMDYKDFKVGLKDLRDEDNIITLDPTEFKLVKDFDLSNNPSLERVRDLYIVDCQLGLRFGDLHRLNNRHIKEKISEDGKMRKYIDIVTEKTNQRVYPPIRPFTERVLEKYNYKLPHISNDKADDYIRKALKFMDIKTLNEDTESQRQSGPKPEIIVKPKYEYITFHTARKYFITECLMKRVPINKIMEWSGHNSDFRVFERYINKKMKGTDFSYDVFED